MMKDVGLDELGELLDGNMAEDEAVHLDGRVRVIGASATDVLFSYEGAATLRPQRDGGYEELTDRDYRLDGDSWRFAFRVEDTTYRDARPTSSMSKGRDERLTAALGQPVDYRLIVEDVSRIRY